MEGSSLNFFSQKGTKKASWNASEFLMHIRSMEKEWTTTYVIFLQEIVMPIGQFTCWYTIIERSINGKIQEVENVKATIGDGVKDSKRVYIVTLVKSLCSQT